MNLQQLLGVALPIIQAPMAGVQGSALAVAVCNAGGLGSLPCAMLGIDAMRNELARIRAQTAAPYNVNFFCHAPPAADAGREARWRAALAPCYAEFGIDAASIPAGPGRLPFSAEAAEALAEFRPAVVSFHFGLPSPELLARVRSWGGHRGIFLGNDLATQVGTLAPVPQIVRAVDVPVIAAGGIADANGVAAALALGAAGVQVGTAYLLCPEATTSAVHRAALASDAARVTALTNLFTGRPARGIVNRVMRELGPISDAPPPFPLATAAIAPLRAAAEARGSSDFSPLWAGQNASGCKAVPAAQLTRELAGASPAVR